MIRDLMNLCQCAGPASQIPILATAPTAKKKKKKIHERFHSDTALMKIHHDAPNSHVPDINFLEFLLHALSITSHHS